VKTQSAKTRFERGGKTRALTLAATTVFGFGLGLLAIAGSAMADGVGVASFYGRPEHGGPTASGERFNMNAMTAAHRTAKMGTHFKVTNLRNGKSVVVRVNDRGPYIGGRIIDLSQAAASKLGFLEAGLAKVKVETIGSQIASQ
jgi:rare lipoprotein A